MIRPSLPILILAMVYPSLAAWLYFDYLDGSSTARWAYLAAKLLQLALPVWVWMVARSRRRFGGRPSKPVLGLRLGTISGAAFVAAGLLTYRWLGPQLAAAGVVDGVRAKLADFQLTEPAAYLAFALVLSLAHAGMEELYWRWLVFGGLRVHMRWPMAMVLSSLAFMAHHVLVLRRFVEPEQWWTLGLAGALSVAVAGAVWCWIYQRSGSLLGAWLSHAMADAVLMWIGYQMIWG